MVLEPMFPVRPLGGVGQGLGPHGLAPPMAFAGSDVMSRLLHAYRGLAMAGPFPPPPHHPAARGPPPGPPMLLRGIPQPQPHPGTIGHGVHPGHPGHHGLPGHPGGHPPLSPPGVRPFGGERPDARASPNTLPMTPNSVSEDASSPGAGKRHPGRVFLDPLGEAESRMPVLTTR